MSGVNKVILVGHLGRAPETKHTQSGSSVVNFSMATTEKWKNKDGEKQEKTEWHRVVTFGKLAEICGQYLQKGKLVYVEGKLQTDKWQDKEGNDRYTTKVIAREMVMLGGKGDAGQGGYEAPASSGSGQSEEDVPF